MPFVPNLFVNVTATWPAKEAALTAYVQEMRAFPHSRSMEGAAALATARGVSAGMARAEAFDVVRRLI